MRRRRAPSDEGYRALHAFNAACARSPPSASSGARARTGPACSSRAADITWIRGIGHEIEVDLQAYGYPILWAQYLRPIPTS